jgi:thymidylate kinase
MDWEEHVTKIVLPSLERNECVVCDCYVFLTLAYQVAQGISLEDLSDALELCALVPMPSVVFLMDCDVCMVKLRRQARGLPEDKNFEAKDTFQQLVREAYLELALTTENDETCFFIIDSGANKTQEQITEEIWELYLTERRRRGEHVSL